MMDLQPFKTMVSRFNLHRASVLTTLFYLSDFTPLARSTGVSQNQFIPHPDVYIFAANSYHYSIDNKAIKPK